MKTVSKLLSLSLALIMGVSANAQNQVHSVAPFNEIAVSDNFRVDLIQSDKHEIQAPAAFTNQNFTVKDGKLRFKKTTELNDFKDVITVYFVSLNDLEIANTAQVKSIDTIKSDRLEIEIREAAKATLTVNVENLETDISGASQLTLLGYANSHESDCGGASILEAQNLTTEKTRLDISGASKVYINTQIVSGESSGSASLITNDNASFENFSSSGVARVNNQQANLNDEIAYEIESSMAEAQREIRKAQKEIESTVNIYKNYKIKRSRKYNAHWSGIDLGFNLYGEDFFSNTLPTGYENMELNFSNSFVFNWNITDYAFRLGNSGFGIGTGIGLGWHVYRFLQKDAIPTIENGFFEVNLYSDDPANPNDRTYKKSKLQSSWVKVPLFIEYQNSSYRHRFYVSIGVVGGVRIGASTKQVYKAGGTHKPKEKDDFYLNPFRADLEARVGIGGLQLFATYGLTNMFAKNKGPELNQFSVGISFFK